MTVLRDWYKHLRSLGYHKRDAIAATKGAVKAVESGPKEIRHRNNKALRMEK